MTKTTKRVLAIAAAVCLAVCAIVLFVLTRNKKIVEEEIPEKDLFFYDSGDQEISYSESAVFYIEEGLIHMIDTATGKDMIYCDRPNCTHERGSTTCSAYIYGWGAGPVLFNNHLYYIGNMTDERVFQEQYLYEMDANGENRKVVATLEGVQHPRYVLYRDHYVVGTYTNTSKLDENGRIIGDIREAGAFVIDLENYTVQFGDKVTKGEPETNGVYYENGAVYYFVSHWDNDVAQLMFEGLQGDYETFFYDHLLFDFYRYDIAKNETTLVKSISQAKSAHFVGNEVYYETRDGWYAIDLKGETRKFEVPESAAGFCKSKDAVYFCCRDYSTNTATYYRMKGEKVEVVMKRTIKEAFIFQCICGNSVYIGYDDEQGNYCFGVLSLEDLDRGLFNVRKLRGYNE